MIFNERLFRSRIEDFEEFYNFVFEIKQSGTQQQKQQISKIYFKIPNSIYGIPASTILHDNKKHSLKLQDWKDLINNIDSYETYVESNKQQGFRGKNYLYKYYFEDEYFGVGICNTKECDLITTFFRDSEKGIDAWLQQNKAQREAPSTVNRHGSLLTEGLNNIITSFPKNVNLNEEIVHAYHGTNNKFTTFSTKFIGNNTGVVNSGFFFTDNKNTAKSYGSRILKCQLDLGAYIECDFANNSTFYFGEEKWYTPNELAKRIQELNNDLQHNSININDWDRYEAEEYLNYLGGEHGFYYLSDDKIDSIICKNVNDNMDFGGQVSTIYIIFDENRIKITNELNERLAYHGTNSKFMKFDPKFFGRMDYGKGFYFTLTKPYAQDYGKYVLTCEIPDDQYYLDYDDPWEWGEDYIKEAIMKLSFSLKGEDREKFEDCIYGDFNTGFYIIYCLAEIFNSMDKAIDYMYKFGIKGLYSFKGDCFVVFKAEDIKIVKTEMNETFSSLNEKLQKYIV